MSPELPPAFVPSVDGELSVGSGLCTKCGLCCTGALHHYAVLDADEIAPARGLGLALRTSGKPGFRLPCPKLQNSVCTIYPDRPRVCGRYKCQLLDDVEAGSTSLGIALEKVRVAKQLVKNAEELVPDGLTLPEARMLALEPADHHSEPRDITMPGRLAIAALCLYLDKHFMNSREGRLLSVVSVAKSAGEMNEP